MTNDPRSPYDREATEPVEVQRYGPPPVRDTRHDDWQEAPAWSSRPEAPPEQSRRRTGLGSVPIIAIAVVAGIVSGSLSALAVSNLVDDRGTTGGEVVSETPDADQVSEVRIEESNAVITATNKVAPAVVTITTTTGGLVSGTGTGSGVIYDAAGWILTNRHVAEDSESMTVTLNDGRSFEGTVYGLDSLTDLAIVKIEGDDLPVAPIGTSESLEPGQLAIAIGNPLGFENTVTTGIVSGLGRVITASDATQTSAETLRNLIQTDAAINPGNSGGPLVNSAGQVIGINTAVNAEAQGLGFAIPIDVAKPIMEQALAGEELQRPWIGVYYVPVTPAIAEEEGLGVDTGALVSSSSGGSPGVFPGSPAEEAGLLEGDVIVAIDGEQITSESDLAALMLRHAPGDTVTLRVLRDSSATDIDVTLGVLPDDAN
jgi:S1-C subfamily serine protease